MDYNGIKQNAFTYDAKQCITVMDRHTKFKDWIRTYEIVAYSNVVLDSNLYQCTDEELQIGSVIRLRATPNDEQSFFNGIVVSEDMFGYPAFMLEWYDHNAHIAEYVLSCTKNQYYGYIRIKHKSMYYVVVVCSGLKQAVRLKDHKDADAIKNKYRDEVHLDEFVIMIADDDILIPFGIESFVVDDIQDRFIKKASRTLIRRSVTRIFQSIRADDCTTFKSLCESFMPENKEFIVELLRWMIRDKKMTKSRCYHFAMYAFFDELLD